ncbi:MBL fold metallo-hydrolase [Neobacillus vireti]|uniref:MBL fold metallo-hydrolase n=1 Tax=Neobacillus vireti TaxID=220686 RepID=UPI002FFD8504
MLNEVADGIFQMVLPLPYSLKSVNSYLIQGEKGFTVIDTGDTKESIYVWEKFLQSGAAIEKVVLTHTHPDHCGLAGWFQGKCNVPITVSNHSFEELNRMKHRYIEDSPLQSILNQHSGPKLPKSIDIHSSPYDFIPSDFYEDGEKIKLGNSWFEAIWTPGHSRDQFCFYNRELQIMIVSDHVLAAVTPMIELRGEEGENPLKDYFTSLDKMNIYPVKLALTGHGQLITNLPTRIDDIKSRHQRRLGQILDILTKESMSAAQIFEHMYENRNKGFLFEQFMAIITRLIYLETIGQLIKEVHDGKIYYRAV